MGGRAVVPVHAGGEGPDRGKVGSDAPPVWPEYNRHGDVLNRWWGLLDEELPEFQFVLYDDGAELVLAQGFTGPLAWTGQDGALPDGIDPAIEQIFAQRRSHEPVSALCALAAEIPHGGRGHGLAAEILSGMRKIAQRNGLRHLIAPVRPSWKERYPLTPIETYVRWRRADGQLLDPWSARTSGDYVFPQGLATVRIDRAADRGSYWEPNVWLIPPDIAASRL